MDNQNTVKEDEFLGYDKVLILVLMDNQNTYNYPLGSFSL